MVGAAARAGFTSFDVPLSACLIVGIGGILVIPMLTQPLLARLAVREWREQLCLTGMHPSAWLRERLKPVLVASALPVIAALLAMWILAAPGLNSLERAWSACSITVGALMLVGFAWVGSLQELERLCRGTAATPSYRRMIGQLVRLLIVSIPFFALCLLAFRAFIVPGLLMAVWLHSGMMRRINRHFEAVCRAYCDFG